MAKSNFKEIIQPSKGFYKNKRGSLIVEKSYLIEDLNERLIFLENRLKIEDDCDFAYSTGNGHLFDDSGLYKIATMFSNEVPKHPIEILTSAVNETKDRILFDEKIGIPFTQFSNHLERQYFLIEQKGDADFYDDDLLYYKVSDWIEEIEKLQKVEPMKKKKRETKAVNFKIELLNQLGFWQSEEFKKLEKMKQYDVLGVLFDCSPTTVRGYLDMKPSNSKSPTQSKKEVKEMLNL